MSGAEVALQQAVVAALTASPALAALSGVYDGPPARAAFPYAALGPIVTMDWSHKTGAGREHRLTLSLWDDGASTVRLHDLMAAADAAMAALPRDLGGHDLVTLLYLRGRVTSDPDGPWVAILDYRARTLAQT